MPSVLMVCYNIAVYGEIGSIKWIKELPEVIAAIIVIAMQAWRRNSILSILAGTIAYMILIRLHLFTI